MIPNYQQFMRPFLQVANAVNCCQSILDNRVGWACIALTKAGLLEATRRAHFVITPCGKKASVEDVDIRKEYLKNFYEFIAFTQKNIDEIDPTNHSNITEQEQVAIPHEILRDAYRPVNEVSAQKILELIRRVTPDFFVDLLIELLIAMRYGGGEAQGLGKSGDNGFAGVIDQDPLGIDQIYIQAKRYGEDNNVGASSIRYFFGALNLKRVQKGIVITTSDFTAAA